MADQFIGEIRIFSGTYAPRDWLFCNGAILPVSQYDSLFSLISCFYGGDGCTTFGLPDFRGRVPLHQGQGMGLTNRVIGSRSGAERVALATRQIPNHRHTLMGVNVEATEHSPQGNSFANTSGDYTFYNDAVNQQMDSLAPQTIDSAGAGNSHLNLMPFTVVNFIIAVNGIYPQRK